ncbi:MAG: response regulator [Desulfuromonas sp.]|nr:response regulator [Desulfuromonas sp.]
MSKKILIVDDSPVVLAMLEDALAGMGYAVTAANNGQAGLKQIEAGKFDLIITDLSMPVMDGIGFVKAAKQLPNCKFVPIVFLSSEEDEAKIAEAKKAGASTFLRKPFKENQLATILKVVLGA